MNSRVIRDVEVEGCAGLDVRIADGQVAEIGAGLARGGDVLDGRGGALIPGLVDHHIHLFALAAQAESVTLDGVATASSFRSCIETALSARPPGRWLRVTGYHEAMAGELSRETLDAIAPRHPIRVQHQTGSLWVLNSLALAAVGAGAATSPSVERDGAGRPTGRIWRGDAWLRERLAGAPPSLAAVGAQLAAFGITAVTDASVTTDADAATRLAEAHRAGELPQRLTLMSGGALEPPVDGAFAVGPLKVLLDDHDLPPLDDFIARIGQARAWRRAVATHCVTAAELALTLAALQTAGARPGDRIEHGGVIPAEAVAVIRELGLTVVTQPAFVLERGRPLPGRGRRGRAGRPLPLRQPAGRRDPGRREFGRALCLAGSLARHDRRHPAPNVGRPAARAGGAGGRGRGAGHVSRRPRLARRRSPSRGDRHGRRPVPAEAAAARGACRAGRGARRRHADRRPADLASVTLNAAHRPSYLCGGNSPAGIHHHG